jgi:hypothetical protein
VTEPPVDAKGAERRKPTRGQRAVAFAFLGAFAATMATVILTGLEVRSPSARRLPETAAVTLAIGEPRIVNLVFDSPTALRDVEFTVDLPPGIEIEGRPGQRRVMGRTELKGGHNVLPLALVAREGRGGQLAARLRLGADQKTFAVDLTVAPR